MPQSLFGGLFDTATTQVLSPASFLLCVGTALLSGLILALLYLLRCHSTRGLVATLAVLPAVVCVVIMMVNGNLGIGVAVAGTFNLVCFRSVPGTAREITAIFLAMGAGLIAGMGYLAYCLLFTLLLGGVSTLYSAINLGARGQQLHKTLHITSGKDGIQSQHDEDTSLGYVYLEAGTYQLNTGDDAIHADNALTIQDGEISIPQCYEGLEGLTVTVAAWAVHSPAHHRTAPSDFSQTPTSGMPGVGVCVALFPAIVYNRVLIIRIGGSSLVGYHPSSFHSQPYPDQRSCGAPTVRSLCR